MSRPPAYLVFDAETIPDGRLVSMVKYPAEELSSDQAIERAQKEALERSDGRSDFLPVTMQIPVAVAVITVGRDLSLQNIVSLDAPKYRTETIVREFWKGVERHFTEGQTTLVTFNGRSFDIPLLELAAFRYGLSLPAHFNRQTGARDRYRGKHIDLQEFMNNHGALWRFDGGLNLLSKLLGKPGKMGTSGEDVYGMYRDGKLEEINQYCVFDTLDTYFVFLRSRVLCGQISLDTEWERVSEARATIEKMAEEREFLGQYLEKWGEWTPWP